MVYVSLLILFGFLNFSLKAQDREPIMNFECPDTSGTLINIDQFKGKVVYMDVWATWCLPCRRQIPKLKELKATYTKKDVVFLYVSLDYKIDKWKKFIERREMEGIHLLSNDFFHSTFSEKYGIYAIPHFILIDKKGNVYQNDAPRPGWPEIKTELDLLLSESE